MFMRVKNVLMLVALGVAGAQSVPSVLAATPVTSLERTTPIAQTTYAAAEPVIDDVGCGNKKRVCGGDYAS